MNKKSSTYLVRKFKCISENTINIRTNDFIKNKDGDSVGYFVFLRFNVKCFKSSM